MDFGLRGRRAAITGGSDGIGLATAKRLLDEGARVAICGRDQQRLADAVARLGGDVLPVQADVSIAEDVERFIAAAVDAFGGLDLLVNNAGTSNASPFDQVADERWIGDYDSKVMAAIRTTRAALPALRASEHAAVVNVTAIGGKHPGAGSVPTTVSRAAGLALTKAMSKDLAADGIRVNAVCIGLVKSGQQARAGEAQGMTPDQYYEKLGASVPLRRFGEAEEVANVIAFLGSDAASYVTGVAVNVDGGLSPVL